MPHNQSAHRTSSPLHGTPTVGTQNFPGPHARHVPQSASVWHSVPSVVSELVDPSVTSPPVELPPCVVPSWLSVPVASVASAIDVADSVSPSGGMQTAPSRHSASPRHAPSLHEQYAVPGVQSGRMP